MFRLVLNCFISRIVTSFHLALVPYCHHKVILEKYDFHTKFHWRYAPIAFSQQLKMATKIVDGNVKVSYCLFVVISPVI